MYSSITSSMNNSQSMNIDQQFNNLLIYQKMLEEYVKTGFTYKSNQILFKISQKHPKSCPYDLLLAVAKIYHMNQFEIIFFTHILNQTRPCYEEEHQNIFGLQGVKFPQEVQKMIIQVFNESEQNSGRGIAEEYLEEENHFNNEDNMEENSPIPFAFTVDELKKIYLYLLVIGYAIKYYLNEPIKAKPYEDYANKHIQNFIPNIFNKWARKYGNTALSTTPRRINAYYMGLGFLEGEEENNNEQQAEDCQYRNYNEIVEELIRATTDGDDHVQINAQEHYQD